MNFHHVLTAHLQTLHRQVDYSKSLSRGCAWDDAISICCFIFHEYAGTEYGGITAAQMAQFCLCMESMKLRC